MRELIKDECGVDPEEASPLPLFSLPHAPPLTASFLSPLSSPPLLLTSSSSLLQERFIVVGCEDIPGFEAVALGEKVRC